MGYYTAYALEFDGPADALDDFTRDLEDGAIIAEEYAEPLKDMVSYGDNYVDSHKWYGWHEDMKNISLNYPNIHLTLWGDGEDGDDKWIAHFINGEVEVLGSTVVYKELSEEFKRRVHEEQNKPYEKKIPDAGKVVEGTANWYEHYQ